MIFRYVLLCIGTIFGVATAVTVINNGLAPPDIVHTPISLKPRCTVKAAPLDLVFILDSSGSLRNQFQDEIDVIRRIVKHVTIGQNATRVMLVQFSGVQHLEFDFNKFNDREDILSALSVLRHVSGITRIGGAFEFAIAKMTAEHGMRGASVPKIIYLLSDGRTHDYPKDAEMSDLARRKIPNVNIWAYGTGEYVALPELLNITKNSEKIITNKNLDKLEGLFDAWKGIEVCEKQPECVKGSDKPLDLFLVIDSSESIDKVFHEQITFAIERIVQHINIHPDAVRLALITYSGQPFLHFKFNDNRFANNLSVIRYLNTLKSIKGTTSTHLALHVVYDLLNDQEAQLRPGVPKLAIVITDGRSARSPQMIANRLRENGVQIIALSMTAPPLVDEDELAVIASSPDHYFTVKNIQNFESIFLNYVGFGCPGIDLGVNAKARVRGATDVTCGPSSVTFTVRTQQPMNGLMYAQQFHDDPSCVYVSKGNSREISITFREGTCGLSKTPSPTLDGYNYNITVILQFHPLIITRADQGLDVSCFHKQPISLQEIGRVTQKRLVDTQCAYRLHRFGPDECAALDAKVGESIYHKWDCDCPSNYAYLVHDCYVKSDRKQAQILDSNGCEIDRHFLETPDYSRFKKPRRGDAYVYQEMSVFKFPGDDNVVFKCKVSLCDMDGSDACVQMIPPRCAARSPTEDDTNGPKRLKRSPSTTKPGFAVTFELETRTLNVLENEAIRPPTPIRYCDLRY